MGPLLKGNIAKIVIYDKWRVNGELTMTPLGHAGFSTHASSKVVILVNRDPARQNDKLVHPNYNETYKTGITKSNYRLYVWLMTPV